MLSVLLVLNSDSINSRLACSCGYFKCDLGGGEGEGNNVYLAEERICKTSRKKSCIKGERNNVICKYVFW